MITYAQNLEDVAIRRAFPGQSSGFYIDVGAHHPMKYSVTKHFYDDGWRGVNIEPNPQSLQRFIADRPDDINLGLALGDSPGTMVLHEPEGLPEAASLDQATAERSARVHGASVHTYRVEVSTLAEVCRRHAPDRIDFLKIDVEGGEKAVIEGGDWKNYRPVLVVVEAERPYRNATGDSEGNAPWAQWEPILLDADYRLVYYDGLNRFYLRQENAELASNFQIPITPLKDRFVPVSLDNSRKLKREVALQIESQIHQRYMSQSSWLGRRLWPARSLTRFHQYAGLPENVTAEDIFSDTGQPGEVSQTYLTNESPENAAAENVRLSTLRKARICYILRRSGLFWPSYYARRYPQVLQSHASPLEHYLCEGGQKGYCPNPLFDGMWYLERYTDVKDRRINPLYHYIRWGWREGRNPGPFFNTREFLCEHSECESSGLNPLVWKLAKVTELLFRCGGTRCLSQDT